MANYLKANDAAIYLKYGTADQAIIGGLNKLKLPGLTRETIQPTAFRTDFDIEETTSGKHGRITYGGNALLGDTKGQDQLKQYIKNNTKFSDARVYLDLVNFLAPDLANDPNAGFQVISHEPGEAQKNGIFSFDGEWAVAGLYCYFVAHLVDGASPTMAFTANTITDSGNGFVAAGFEAGQTVIVEGSTSNDGSYLIESVAAGTITLAGSPGLTVENAVSGTAIHGGKL